MKDKEIAIPDFSNMPEHRSFEKTKAKKKKFYDEKMPRLKMNVYVLDEEDVLQMILKDRRLKEQK